ncbi:MAG: beta-eliminating lyase-related protein [Eubacterium sp.]|nr:beta-eliminating lyase-related protein [Eubacterium sp.]MDD7208734.1 beta-eliminating lyase-related protein [Lachnospiraceae bacterium]MDY5497761.1 beta-eliminating lyase-related protein [Anaerobutyricum sp.]
MLYFENDYSEGAHEEILRNLMETNDEKLPGYGTDFFCERAKKKILKACECPDGEVYFLVGGTQTNATVIDGMLQQYEGVVAAGSGHISVHEAGAIEASGHKVLTLSQIDGKIHAEELRTYLETYFADENHEHMVFPGMVYLSHPTEYGTLYSKKELTDISGICREYNLPLYLDGARLGYGLASEENDLSLPEIASLCDVFYIGGTKVGALCGEAVVFTKNNAPRHFMTIVKQHGALLAKGRLLGVQFDTLFTDELYLKISKNAIETAEMLKKGLREKEYEFYIDSPTNQIFLVLSDREMEEWKKKVVFSFWEKIGENQTVIRLATSWATKKKDVEELLSVL